MLAALVQPRWPFLAHFAASPPSIAFLIVLSVLITSKAQQTSFPDCSTCGDVRAPVCISQTTFLSLCLARCQGITDAAKEGSCPGDDLGTGWTAQASPVTASTLGVSAAQEAQATPSYLPPVTLTSALAKRYLHEGFVLTAVVPRIQAGPSSSAGWDAALASAFASGSTEAARRHLAAAATLSNALNSSQTVLIRAMRLSPDGALYTERAPVPLDLSTLPTSASSPDDSSPLPPPLPAPRPQKSSPPPRRWSPPPHRHRLLRTDRSTAATAAGRGTATVSNAGSRASLHTPDAYHAHFTSLNGTDALAAAAHIHAAHATTASMQSIHHDRDRDDMGAAEDSGMHPLHEGSGQQRRQQHRQRRRLQQAAAGADPRYSVTATAFPYRYIGQLLFLDRSAGSTSRMLCTGTLISPYDVLTAAHCVYNLAAGVAYSDWRFSPAQAGSMSPYGVFSPAYVTWYRVELPVQTGTVNYYDLAVIRLLRPSPVGWMGIKYSCSNDDFPDAQSCGYPIDRGEADGYTQACTQCYFPSTACQPGVQAVTNCYSVPGQSGSAIWDLTDYRVLGVLSGGPSTQYSITIFTPMDALHFAAITRWLWTSGPSTTSPAQSRPPLPPPPGVDAVSPPPPGAGPDASCSSEGAVRLVGPSAEAGRLEVCHDGSWGSVCETYFGSQEAAVVCRQLGLRGGVPVPSGYFPMAPSDLTIWLDEVQCSGSETTLSQCYPAVGGSWGPVDACTHAQDIGIVCDSAPRPGASSPPPRAGSTLGSVTATPSSSPSTPRFGRYPCSPSGAVRLMPALPSGAARPTTRTARVEICSGGQWGTVCSDSWDDADARVACRQVGYAFGVAVPAVAAGATPGVPPGADDMRILLSRVNCTGSEATLARCASGRVACSHRQDAGVVCSARRLAAAVPRVRPNCTAEGQVRLVGGLTPASGRVQVCHQGVWGGVCSTAWDSFDAFATCKALGYMDGRRMVVRALPWQPVWMAGVDCSFTAQIAMPRKLTQCAAAGLAGVPVPCRAPELAAGLSCAQTRMDPQYSSSTCELMEEGSVQLQGGSTTGEGVLQVCRRGFFGTVCMRGFTYTSAQVVCAQLGYTRGIAVSAMLYTEYDQPPPEMRVWAEGVACAGSERSLLECPNAGWGNTTCSHAQDVGIICS